MDKLTRVCQLKTPCPKTGCSHEKEHKSPSGLQHVKMLCFELTTKSNANRLRATKFLHEEILQIGNNAFVHQDGSSASLSGDGRTWPSNPKVVNPAASRRVLISGGADHCWSRADSAAGSSRRCDTLAGAYVKARPLGTASSEIKKWLPDNKVK